jgi:hypothetical protein
MASKKAFYTFINSLRLRPLGAPRNQNATLRSKRSEVERCCAWILKEAPSAPHVWLGGSGVAGYRPNSQGPLVRVSKACSRDFVKEHLSNHPVPAESI